MSAGAVERFEAGLAEVAAAYRDAFAAVSDEQALRAANARLVGPQGALTLLLKLMPELPGDRRRPLVTLCHLGWRGPRLRG